jgi:hypothetical protein
MINIVIYPQKVRLTGSKTTEDQQKEQQERVRDYLQYLKVAKQVLSSSKISQN